MLRRSDIAGVVLLAMALQTLVVGAATPSNTLKNRTSRWPWFGLSSTTVGDQRSAVMEPQYVIGIRPQDTARPVMSLGSNGCRMGHTH